ncbi:MAG: TetR/AcrR family transcriptional regulator [Candidatus Glassbacteria bacterium]
MPRLSAERKGLLETLTRQQIREAVASVIARYGVQGLTMEKIASEAGVAKGTLYRYFNSKSRLLRDTVDSCFACMTEEINRILGGNEPARERIARMIRCHLEYFDRNRAFFRVLLYERNLSQSSLNRFTNSLYRSFLERIAAVISEGIAAGAFREVSPLMAASLVVEANIAVICQRLVDPQPGDPDADVRLLTDFILNGISSTQTAAEGAE